MKLQHLAVELVPQGRLVDLPALELEVRELERLPCRLVVLGVQGLEVPPPGSRKLRSRLKREIEKINNFVLKVSGGFADVQKNS